MIFSAAIDGKDKVQKRLLQFARRVEAGTDTTTLDFARMMLANMQSNLSGKPGFPQPHTFDYRNSWFLIKLDDGSYQIATLAPQSFRLEYGFVGTDSLGRYYVQPALPHVAITKEQTIKEAVPMYVKMIERAAKL